MSQSDTDKEKGRDKVERQRSRARRDPVPQDLAASECGMVVETIVVLIQISSLTLY